MNLKDQIKADKEKIAVAHETYMIAERLFNSIENPIKYRHKKILDNFRQIINNKIESEHKCEHCSPDLYDSAHFTENGISMRIDASHPNDIVDTPWTWDEIQTIINNFINEYSLIEKLEILTGTEHIEITTKESTTGRAFEFSTTHPTTDSIHEIFKHTDIAYSAIRPKSITTFHVDELQFKKLNDHNTIQSLFS
jgi:hypothetical protein